MLKSSFPMHIWGTCLAISIAVVVKYAGWQSKPGPKSCAPTSPWPRCLVMPPPCVRGRKAGPPSRCNLPCMTRFLPASAQPLSRDSVSPQGDRSTGRMPRATTLHSALPRKPCRDDVGRSFPEIRDTPKVCRLEESSRDRAVNSGVLIVEIGTIRAAQEPACASCLTGRQEYKGHKIKLQL